MGRFNAIIFDLDGTLVHSAPDLQAAANAALTGLGRPPLDLTTVTSFVGNGVEKLMERCLATGGGVTPDLLAVALTRFRRHYDANLTTLTRPYPGVVDCLARLRHAGCKLAVCTNKPVGPARTICDQLQLDGFFHAITGAEPGLPRKPDPQPLLATVTRLGVPAAETLYVGDSDVDFATARNAGIAFRLFSGGYRAGPIPGLDANLVFDDWAGSGLFRT